MIAKVIAWGRDRDEALARLRRALRGDDGRRATAARPTSRSCSTCSTGPRWSPARPTPAGSTALAAADERLTDARRRRRAASRRRSTRPTSRGGRRAAPRSSPRPAAAGRSASHEIGREVELRHRGQAYRLDRRARSARGRYRVGVDGGDRRRRASIGSGGCDEPAHRSAAGAHPVVSVAGPPDHLVEVDGVVHRVSRDDGGMVRAPAPALVVAVPVGAGDEVEAGPTRRGAREHEDGDRGHRAVRRARPATSSSRATSRSTPVRRCCASSRAATSRRRPRPAAGRVALARQARRRRPATRADPAGALQA